jgi:hypothetical protein
VTADEEAQAHERRRESIQRRLARVEAAIAEWHAWEANQARPAKEQHGDLTKPDLSLAGCLDLRRMLRAEVARLGPA